jgi:hypothetical protein
LGLVDGNRPTVSSLEGWTRTKAKQMINWKEEEEEVWRRRQCCWWCWWWLLSSENNVYKIIKEVLILKEWVSFYLFIGWNQVKRRENKSEGVNEHHVSVGSHVAFLPFSCVSFCNLDHTRAFLFPT